MFQLEVTDSSSGSIDIVSYVEMVHDRGYLSYLRNAYDEWVQDGGSAVHLVDNGFPRFSTHTFFRMRYYRQRFHTRSCYLHLVKATSTNCLPLPKQVCQFGVRE